MLYFSQFERYRDQNLKDKNCHFYYLVKAFPKELELPTFDCEKAVEVYIRSSMNTDSVFYF